MALIPFYHVTNPNKHSSSNSSESPKKSNGISSSSSSQKQSYGASRWISSEPSHSHSSKSSSSDYTPDERPYISEKEYSERVSKKKDKIRLEQNEYKRKIALQMKEDAIAGTFVDERKRQELRKNALEIKVVDGVEYYLLPCGITSHWFIMPDVLETSQIDSDPSYIVAHAMDNDVYQASEEYLLLGGYNQFGYYHVSLPRISMSKSTYMANNLVVLRMTWFDEYDLPEVSYDCSYVYSTDLKTVQEFETGEFIRLNGDGETYTRHMPGKRTKEQIVSIKTDEVLVERDFLRADYPSDHEKLVAKQRQQLLRQQRENEIKKEENKRLREANEEKRKKSLALAIKNDPKAEMLKSKAEEYKTINGKLYLKIKTKNGLEWFVYDTPVYEEDSHQMKLILGGTEPDHYPTLVIDSSAYEKFKVIILHKADMSGIEFDENGEMIVDKEKDAYMPLPYGPAVDYSEAYFFNTNLKFLSKLSGVPFMAHIADDLTGVMVWQRTEGSAVYLYHKFEIKSGKFTDWYLDCEGKNPSDKFNV